jgi:L-ascorbate metabolism protein UlaG (beta-lactamase superfamily)
MQPLAITWLGHSSFRVRTPGGKEVLFDPWYTGNPAFVEAARPARADLILISHGHSDHFADAEALARATGATVVAMWEITSYLGTKGIKHVEPMNKGGTITAKGLRITMTDARHSSSFDDNGIVYLGEAAGFVVALENGQTIYFAGDTALFLDMKLIGLAGLDLAVLPIGDQFTRGPEDSIEAIKFLNPRKAAPCHYNTWPPIAQDAGVWAEEVRRQTAAEPLVVEPGGSFVV